MHLNRATKVIMRIW